MEELLRRVEILETRLAALEAGHRPQTMPAPLPDRVAAGYPPPFLPPSISAAPSKPAPEVDETEYFLGAHVLPRAGAVLLILGIGYLVSLAVSHGLLGPRSLFVLAIVICLAFVGVGQRYREERAQFGEVLTGIGSGGLYVTFTAGHVVQGLYSGETLVGLFLGLSFMNLAYSLWRASPAFLAIGIVGGFSAAMMPLRNGAFTMTTILHATILLVAVAVAARHRWSAWVVGIPALAMAIAAPLPFVWPVAWAHGVGLVCLSAVVATAGLARLREDESPLYPIVGAGALVAFAALHGFLVWKGLSGSVFVLAFSTWMALLGFLVSKRMEVRAGIGFAAALAAGVIAPLGVERATYLMIYPFLAILSAILAVKGGRLPFLLGVITLWMGLVSYVPYYEGNHLAHVERNPLPFAMEMTFLGMVTLASAGLGLTSRVRDWEAGGLGGAVLTASYLAFLTLTKPLGISPNEAGTVTMTLGSLLFLVVGFARHLAALRFIAFFGLALTVGKVFTVDLASVAPTIRVLLLMLLGLLMLGAGYGYIWHRRTQERREERAQESG